MIGEESHPPGGLGGGKNQMPTANNATHTARNLASGGVRP